MLTIRVNSQARPFAHMLRGGRKIGGSLELAGHWSSSRISERSWLKERRWRVIEQTAHVLLWPLCTHGCILTHTHYSTLTHTLYTILTYTMHTPQHSHIVCHIHKIAQSSTLTRTHITLPSHTPHTQILERSHIQHIHTYTLYLDIPHTHKLTHIHVIAHTHRCIHAVVYLHTLTHEHTHMHI